MHMVRKPVRHTARKKVTPLKNDYVSTIQEKEQWKRRQKKRLKRNLTIFALVVLISFGLMANLFFNQKTLLAEKLEEKEMMLSQLAQVEEEHTLLTRELEKLNDDEYIAKLAREAYFLSNENEIIFSLPKKKEKSDEKNK